MITIETRTSEEIRVPRNTRRLVKSANKYVTLTRKANGNIFVFSRLATLIKNDGTVNDPMIDTNWLELTPDELKEIVQKIGLKMT